MCEAVDMPGVLTPKAAAWPLARVPWQDMAGAGCLSPGGRPWQSLRPSAGKELAELPVMSSQLREVAGSSPIFQMAALRLSELK